MTQSLPGYLQSERVREWLDGRQQSVDWEIRQGQGDQRGIQNNCPGERERGLALHKTQGWGNKRARIL